MTVIPQTEKDAKCWWSIPHADVIKPNAVSRQVPAHRHGRRTHSSACLSYQQLASESVEAPCSEDASKLEPAKEVEDSMVAPN